MSMQRGLLLFTTLSVAACPAADPPVTTTDNDDTSSTGAPGTSAPATSSTGGSTEPTDTGAHTSGATDTGATSSPGETSAPGSSTDTGHADTDSTDTDSTDTDSTDTDSTDTGAPVCDAGWAVPRVDVDALAKHDLAWVGCEFTACGPEDSPMPGDPSLLCEAFVAADAPLEYLGLVTLNEVGAFTTDDVVSPMNFAWLDGKRHIYRYDENILIMTEADGAADQLDVYYTARGLEILRTQHPAVYQALVVDPMALPDGPTLDGFGWKNRLRSFVISFDTSPLYIAAGLTVLDAAPVVDMQTDLDTYSNAAAVSVDRETIRGASDTVGSRPIYDRPSDDENFLRYMREGVVETLVHEFLHLRVDRLNSVDEDMLALYNRRGDPNACASFELEETLVAATSLLYFREAGGLSDTYLDYYDVVLDANREILMQCPEYAMWEQQFSMPSGLDERYDLRLFDLQ